MSTGKTGLVRSVPFTKGNKVVIKSLEDNYGKYSDYRYHQLRVAFLLFFFSLHTYIVFCQNFHRSEKWLGLKKFKSLMLTRHMSKITGQSRLAFRRADTSLNRTRSYEPVGRYNFWWTRIWCCTSKAWIRSWAIESDSILIRIDPCVLYGSKTINLHTHSNVSSVNVCAFPKYLFLMFWQVFFKYSQNLFLIVIKQKFSAFWNYRKRSQYTFKDICENIMMFGFPIFRFNPICLLCFCDVKKTR